MADLGKLITTQKVPQLWYISSPYTHDDPAVVAERVKRVEVLIQKLDKELKNISNVTLFSPVLYSEYLHGKGFTPEAGWHRYLLPFLTKADMLLVYQLEGWDTSAGVALETAYALGYGKHITYANDKDEYLQYLPEQDRRMLDQDDDFDLPF